MASVLIAGQAPGRRAHESGVPFDDPSGNRLRDWLGVSREQFYDPSLIAIVPMGFCYPGTGSRGDLPPRTECAPAWRDQLLAKLTGVDTTIVIGMYAQRWHLADECANTVAENVESWQKFWPDIVPLPHPSPRNARWLKSHPVVENTIVPALRSHVGDLLRSG